MSHSCARALEWTGRPVCSSPQPWQLREDLPALRCSRLPGAASAAGRPPRRREPGYSGRCAAHKAPQSLEASQHPQQTRREEEGAAPPQAKAVRHGVGLLRGLPVLPCAVAAAWCLVTGAAYAAAAPEDCAALLPAEQALDTIGIMADQNTVIVAASILEAVALLGAVVGGVIARTRKDETDRLNQQLRQINLQLRKQARMESYAPGLSYAPAAVAAGRPLPSPSAADNNGVSHERAELLKRLKTGKKWLREQRPALALEEFKIALGLARAAHDPVSEKKAARGLGASCQRLGRYKEAIGYHEIVLKTSERAGDSSGDTDAYGAIADCYTEMGDLERAGKFYDQYISRLQSSESVDLDN